MDAEKLLRKFFDAAPDPCGIRIKHYFEVWQEVEKYLADRDPEFKAQR